MANSFQNYTESPTWIFSSELTGPMTIKSREQTIMALGALDWLSRIKRVVMIDFSVTSLTFNNSYQRIFQFYRTVNEGVVSYEIVYQWDERIQSSDIEQISEWLWQLI